MHKGLFTTSVFALLTSTLCSAKPPIVVNLPYGSFRGSPAGNITRYLGIPFAAPPVGPLRFSPPKPPPRFSGIRDATAFGPACPQQEAIIPDVLPFEIPSTTPPPAGISEDCLHINVWVPDVPNVPNLSGPLPVAMWIYGGGFESGHTSAYDPSDIVERSRILNQPMIVVSANYRVNAFGFLPGKEVQKAGLANVGLQDQRFAMQWIQSYISAFGGDPKRVVIWGESAGAISVGLHLVYQNGNTGGLFRGAFMESGAPSITDSMASGQHIYDQLVALCGCSKQGDTLQCLRNAPFDALMAAVNAIPSVFNYTSLNLAFQPRSDGVILTTNAQRLVQAGKYAKVPLVSGNCADEGTLFTLANTNITYALLHFRTSAQFAGYVRNNYIPNATPGDISAVSAAYPDDPTQGSPFGTGENNQLTPQFKRLAAFTGDFIFQAPRRRFVQVASSTQPVWSFLYARQQATPFLGSFHSSDLTEFFSYGGAAAGNDFIGTDALVNFVNNLDPSFSSPKTPRGISLLEKITWPKYSSPAPVLLAFQDPNPTTAIINDTYRSEAMQLLTKLSLKLP